MCYQNLYDTKELNSWKGLIDFYYDNNKFKTKSWCFRGQENADWDLQTSLEWAARRLGKEWDEFPTTEEGLLRHFKRQAHHYITDVPADDQFIEWLSLMRHHGAPTRLIDWTYSFFVAVYFAIETVQPQKRCAIWAIDSDWLRRRAEAVLPNDAKEKLTQDRLAKNPGTVAAIVQRSEPIPLVFTLNPFRLNQRLVLQQGRFLVPGDVGRSFMENMRVILEGFESKNHFIKLNILCTQEFIHEAIRGLHSMNITRATLFPDLDGFSKNLRNLIAIPRAIDVPGSSFSKVPP
jgi:hypothetical protein